MKKHSGNSKNKAKIVALLIVGSCTILLLLKMFYPVSLVQAAHIPKLNIDSIDRIVITERCLPGNPSSTKTLTSSKDIEAFMQLLSNSRVCRLLYSDQNKLTNFYYERLGNFYDVALVGDEISVAISLSFDGTAFLNKDTEQYKFVKADLNPFIVKFSSLLNNTEDTWGG